MLGAAAALMQSLLIALMAHPVRPAISWRLTGPTPRPHRPRRPHPQPLELPPVTTSPCIASMHRQAPTAGAWRGRGQTPKLPAAPVSPLPPPHPPPACLHPPSCGLPRSLRCPLQCQGPPFWTYLGALAGAVARRQVVRLLLVLLPLHLLVLLLLREVMPVAQQVWLV